MVHHNSVGHELSPRPLRTACAWLLFALAHDAGAQVCPGAHPYVAKSVVLTTGWLFGRNLVTFVSVRLFWVPLKAVGGVFDGLGDGDQSVKNMLTA